MHWVFQSTHVHGNVVFNFRANPMDDLAAFADGYHRAGRALTARLSEAAGYRDYEGYPILYIYRHALELYLKAIVYRGFQFLDLVEADRPKVKKLLTSHRLTMCLPAMHAIFKAVGWSWGTDVKGMQSYREFEGLVRGIEEMDPGSFVFRYPVNCHGNAALGHHTIVNVVDFARNLDPILDLLSGAVLGLHEEFDATAEMTVELRDMLGAVGGTE